MLALIVDLCLMGLALALLVVFSLMRIEGRYVAIEDNVWIWASEVVFFALCLALVVVSGRDYLSRLSRWLGN